MNTAAAWAWVAVAIIAGIAEVATLNLVLAMVAGGALVAAFSVFLGLSGLASGWVFAVASAALLGLARPPLLRYLARTAPSVPMHTAALVGQAAVALTPVTRDAGTVRLAGEVWSAHTEPGAAAIEVDSRVRVLRIDGATAVVTPVLDSPDPSATLRPGEDS